MLKLASDVRAVIALIAGALVFGYNIQSFINKDEQQDTKHLELYVKVLEQEEVIKKLQEDVMRANIRLESLK
jgi:chromosome condensin MukBEF ATPase and DNA-binding subunit MukB